MSVGRLVGILAAASIVVSAAWAQAAGLELAVAKSKESGLPLLVIGATETCPHCVNLEKRLTTEPELQPLVAQYVPIKVMVDDPDFAAWSQRYRPTGNGVPMIFIVASDGKEIVNQSGAPQGDGLKQLLLQGIQATGGFKNALPESAGIGTMKADKALRLAKRLLARDQKAAAIEALAPLLRKRATSAGEDSSLGEVNSLGKDSALGEDGDAGDPKAEGETGKDRGSSEKDSELDRLARSLTQEANAELDKAIEKSTQADGALLAAVMHAKVRRIYGGLPDMQTALDGFAARYESDAEKAPLLEQARLIDRAREFDERRSTIRAAAIYRQVIEEYPDTEAAKLCEQRLRQIESGKSKSASSSTVLRTWTDASGAFQVEASLVAVEGDVVVLKKSGGETVRTPLDKLSDEDRRFIESRAK